MEIVALAESNVTAVALRAAAMLGGGGVALIPTDTVYGLAVTADHGGAVLARVKGRDPDKPVAVLVAEPAEGLNMFADPSAGLRGLVQAGWPGPLTVVGPAGDLAPPAAVTAAGTIGVRCPAHAFVHALAAAAGPLSVTSANAAGAPPLRTLEALDRWPELSGVALAVDGGVLRGTASTVVDATGDEPYLLRAGPVDEATVREWWG